MLHQLLQGLDLLRFFFSFLNDIARSLFGLELLSRRVVLIVLALLNLGLSSRVQTSLRRILAHHDSLRDTPASNALIE